TAPGGDGPVSGEAFGTASGVGLEAARRALRVTRTPGFEPLEEAPYVAAFTPVANIAVGEDTPWGVAAELERLLPGTETATYRSCDVEETAGAGDPDGTLGFTTRVLAAAGERRIVAVVRDVHRHAWMAAALAGLVAARPGTVVVEMGVPQAPPTGALHLATHGAARVCGEAAAEAIVSAR
ncbi:MAG: glycoside hydrolase family 3 protein, partial [Streptomyces sp.]|nr:glycoside hydrolase family 3 protein [Streptomyces sp.]